MIPEEAIELADLAEVAFTRTEERDRARAVAVALEGELAHLVKLIEQQRARHVPDGSRCDRCWDVWPCPTSQALAAVLDAHEADKAPEAEP